MRRIAVSGDFDGVRLAPQVVRFLRDDLASVEDITELRTGGLERPDLRDVFRGDFDAAVIGFREGLADALPVIASAQAALAGDLEHVVIITENPDAGRQLFALVGEEEMLKIMVALERATIQVCGELNNDALARLM